MLDGICPASCSRVDHTIAPENLPPRKKKKDPQSRRRWHSDGFKSTRERTNCGDQSRRESKEIKKTNLGGVTWIDELERANNSWREFCCHEGSCNEKIEGADGYRGECKALSRWTTNLEKQMFSTSQAVTISGNTTNQANCARQGLDG